MDLDRQELRTFVEQGDRDAMGRLLQRHLNRLYTMALRVLNNTAEAEDVAQDACVKAMAAAGSYRGECAVKSWLLRITFNLALNRKRDRQRGKDHEGTAGRSQHENKQSASQEDLQEVLPVLQSAIAELDPKFQAAVIMHYYDEMTQTEIADVMGCTQRTIHYRLGKAMEALKSAFQSKGHMAMVPLMLPALQQVKLSIAPQVLVHSVQTAAATATVASLTPAVTSALTQTATLGGDVIMKLKTFAIASVAVASLSFGGGYMANQLAVSAPTEPEVAEVQEQLGTLRAEMLQNKKQADANYSALQTAHQDMVVLKQQLAEAKDARDLALAASQASRKSLKVLQTNRKSGETTSADLTAENEPKNLEKVLGQFSKLADMLDDPSMKKMMKMQAKAMVDMMFDDVYDLMNLSAEDAEELKLLLHDRAITMMMGSLSQFADVQDEVGMLEASNNIKNLKQEKDDGIRNLLGDAQYSKFQYYEETSQERQFVSGFMAGLDNELPQYQRDRIIDIMHEENKSSAMVSKFGQQDNKDPAVLMEMFDEFNSGDFGARFHEEQIVVDARVAERVRPLLNAAEFDSFQQRQQSQREMMQASFSMLNGMFGGSEDSEK